MPLQNNSRHLRLRSLVWIVNILVGAATIFSAYGGLIDPRVSVLPALAAMTFPVWLVLTLVLLVADLFIYRVSAWLPAAVLIVCLGPIMAYSPLNLGENNPRDGTSTFTLMSYNVYDFDDYLVDHGAPPDEEEGSVDQGPISPNPTVDYILASGADVLFLQEAPPLEMCAKVGVTPEQIVRMQQRYPYQHHVSNEYIYSRYPLTPVELRQPGTRSAAFAAATAEIDGRLTLLVCVHLESYMLLASDKAPFVDLTHGHATRKTIRELRHKVLSKMIPAFRNRAEQAVLLRQQLDSLPYKNVVLGGDFNDIPDCWAVRTIRGDEMRSAFAIAGRGPMMTYHATNMYFNIDHILYRGDLEAVEYGRGSCPYSDHYPVEARFEFAPR